ncbi:hypothetical protein PFICI_13605 [Pestalotiopsis fici W106-1]|uniref:Uncharacterized protein n=1 Tax=Pestalotiopsis fici (strain W106-1 / CGMCC3.15140) TaxID=1229662 RepID=W3WQL3_PESFW|nr:uncharacterized protein PFICI_13605 [Pestalotiopsis fici W106-1]ETS75121.1 hypothetical protein PFICI_13605 [Pestalotiopsis fici W106-1]
MTRESRFLELTSLESNCEQVQLTLKDVIKKKLDHEQAALELGLVLKLAETRILAAQRLSCLFLHLGVSGIFGEFTNLFIRGGWNLPMPDWVAVYRLVRQHQDDPVWRHRHYPADAQIMDKWDVNHHYAKVILSVFVTGKATSSTMSAEKKDLSPEVTNRLVSWLRICDANEIFWIVFHALTYLKLEAERKNKPLPRRVRIIRRLTMSRK